MLSWSLNDGWQLFAPGLPTPIALSGQSIDNTDYWAAQRWASAIILREGHKVVSWIDGFDPHGEEGYVPVLAEPLPVAEAEEARRGRVPARHPRRGAGSVADGVSDDRAPRRPRLDDHRGRPRAGDPSVGRRFLAGVGAAAGQARGQDARPAHRLPGAAGHRRLRRPRPGAGHRAHPVLPTRRNAGDSPRGRPGRGGARHRRHGHRSRSPGRGARTRSRSARSRAWSTTGWSWWSPPTSSPPSLVA